MFESNTYNAILERMLDRVSNKFDKREGSVIFDTHSPTALELQFLYIELERIIKEAYGDTASREFLIRRCRERGITPYKATSAVLKGEFAPSNVDVVGKRFNIGSVNYVVLDRTANGEYRVQCEARGIIGNQQLGTMIPIDYIEGLETAELTEVLIPGEDEEETEALRKRYFASFEEKAFGGNVRDYLDKTNSIPGVGAVKVTRVWNTDISPSKMIPTEAVRAWYETVISTLDGEPAEWLKAVFGAAEQKKLTTGGTVLLTILGADLNPASETLIHIVQETIDPRDTAGDGKGLAPIGHVVTVESAIPCGITVKTDITFDPGYDWTRLKVLIDEAISDYLSELRSAWADSPYLVVRIRQIEMRLLDITGIGDIDNTAINGNPANLTLGKYEIPMYEGASAW